MKEYSKNNEYYIHLITVTHHAFKKMKEPDKTIELPEPWYWTDQDLSQQLQLETGEGHPLHGANTKTIARRQDCDDVLFAFGYRHYAVVHLTWQKGPHPDPRRPVTKIYPNWQDVYNNTILPDAELFK